MTKRKKLTRKNSTYLKIQRIKGGPSNFVSVRWIIQWVILVSALAIGLFIYFHRKTEERRAAVTREYQEVVEDEKSKVILSCNNLFPLEDGYYSAYYINDQGISLLTKFNVDKQGKLVDLNGNELKQPLRAWNANDYILKIVSPDNKETVIMTGKPTMEFIYKNLLLQAKGHFILATPSDNDPYNEGKGIWFAKAEEKGWRPLLSIPTPPEGWRYAAWLFINNQILLIGRFISGEGEDMNKSYYTGVGPSVPGEDFITNLPNNMQITDIRMGEKPSVLITLEPNWYNNSYPLPITILAAEINTNTILGSQVQMSLAIDSLPYCTLTPSSWITK